MYVPDMKPKPKEEVKEASTDFKVEIYVSKKPEAISPSLTSKELQN